MLESASNILMNKLTCFIYGEAEYWNTFDAGKYTLIIFNKFTMANKNKTKQKQKQRQEKYEV